MEHSEDIKKMASMGEFQGENRYWPKQNTKAHLTFAILIIPETIGEIFCGLMRRKWNFWCVSRHIWCKTNTAFQKKNIIQTVKHGDNSVMVWSCFAASGPGWLAVIDGSMNSALYQEILKENFQPSVCDLKLKHTWVMQQDSDPEHTSMSNSEWLKKTKWRFWSGQNNSAWKSGQKILCSDVKVSNAWLQL